MIVIGVFAAVYMVWGRGPVTQVLFGVSMLAAWLFLVAIIVNGFRLGLTGSRNLLMAELCMISGYAVATLAYYGTFPDNDFISFMPAKIGNILQLIFFSLVIGERARVAIVKSAEDHHQLRLAQALSKEDFLTGLNNRRAFFEFGAQIFEESRRYKVSCGIIMIDIDLFKSVNDRFGHIAGDEVICTVANLCQEIARDADVVGRLGGEEFAIILPNTGVDGTQQLAERIRKAVADAEPEVLEGARSLSVSAGVAVCDASDSGIENTLNRADQALYRAKCEGRNCVRLWQPSFSDMAAVTDEGAAENPSRV